MTAPTLLIAFDGSASAAAAVRVAGALFPGAPAVIAHVRREPATPQAVSLARIAISDATIAGGLAALDRAAVEEAEATVAIGLGAASDVGLKAEVAIVAGAGTPWHDLRRLARDRDARVIVCGSRGLGPFSRAAVGSTSSGLLHHADRPVLVVPEGGGVPAGPVIVGYDGSDAANAAVRHAVALFPDRDLLVANVWESLVRHSLGGRALAFAPVETARSLTEDLDELVRSIATDVAEQGVAIAAAGGRPATARAVEAQGSAWHGLLAAARAAGGAPIVVGSRGRGTVAAAVLGSVSSRLVHDADVPVLVVPHGVQIRGRAPAVEAVDRGENGA